MNVWLDTRLRAGARRCGVMLLCMCLAWVAAPHCATAEPGADPARDASARELFEQGVALAERGDWVAAEDRFRRALSLRNSSVIAYNLASALCEQGKLVEASELLHRVLADDKIVVTQTDKGVISQPSALNEEILGSIEKLTAEFWPGAVVVPIMSAGATDGSYLRNAGIPTYGHSGLASDVDDVRAHGKDERVAVKVLRRRRISLSPLRTLGQHTRCAVRSQSGVDLAPPTSWSTLGSLEGWWFLRG